MSATQLRYASNAEKNFLWEQFEPISGNLIIKALKTQVRLPIEHEAQPLKSSQHFLSKLVLYARDKDPCKKYLFVMPEEIGDLDEVLRGKLVHLFNVLPESSCILFLEYRGARQVLYYGPKYKSPGAFPLAFLRIHDFSKDVIAVAQMLKEEDSTSEVYLYGSRDGSYLASYVFRSNPALFHGVLLEKYRGKMHGFSSSFDISDALQYNCENTPECSELFPPLGFSNLSLQLQNASNPCIEDIIRLFGRRKSIDSRVVRIFVDRILRKSPVSTRFHNLMTMIKGAIECSNPGAFRTALTRLTSISSVDRPNSNTELTDFVRLSESQIISHKCANIPENLLTSTCESSSYLYQIYERDVYNPVPIPPWGVFSFNVLVMSEELDPEYSFEAVKYEFSRIKKRRSILLGHKSHELGGKFEARLCYPEIFASLFSTNEQWKDCSEKTVECVNGLNTNLSQAWQDSSVFVKDALVPLKTVESSVTDFFFFLLLILFYFIASLYKKNRKGFEEIK